MPTDQYFSVEVLVGKCSIPEYTKDDSVYVESNLFTPVSYCQKVSEVVNGETETQNVPVTPYMIRLAACGPVLPERFSYYFRVMVDGVKVKGVSLSPGDHKLIKGFRDGRVVRELLFSMPKNSKNKDEKLDENKVPRIGKIEVECWKAQLLERSWELRQTALDFQQASKQDSMQVTNGSYTMATSKAGRELYQRRIFRSVDQWKRVELLSSQSIQYHMGHTLQTMGIKLKPYPIMALSTMALTDKVKLGLKSEEAKEEEPSTSTCVTERQSRRRQQIQHVEEILLEQSEPKRRCTRKPVRQATESESFVTSQTRDIVTAKEKGHSMELDEEAIIVKDEDSEDVMAEHKEDIMNKSSSSKNQNGDVIDSDNDADGIEILQVLDNEKKPTDVIDLT